jgi:hypothetical protein
MMMGDFLCETQQSILLVTNRRFLSLPLYSVQALHIDLPFIFFPLSPYSALTPLHYPSLRMSLIKLFAIVFPHLPYSAQMPTRHPCSNHIGQIKSIRPTRWIRRWSLSVQRILSAESLNDITRSSRTIECGAAHILERVHTNLSRHLVEVVIVSPDPIVFRLFLEHPRVLRLASHLVAFRISSSPHTFNSSTDCAFLCPLILSRRLVRLFLLWHKSSSLNAIDSSCRFRLLPSSHPYLPHTHRINIVKSN